MAPVNVSVPEEVKAAFDKAFARENKSAVVARLTRAVRSDHDGGAASLGGCSGCAPTEAQPERGDHRVKRQERCVRPRSRDLGRYPFRGGLENKRSAAG